MKKKTTTKKKKKKSLIGHRAGEVADHTNGGVQDMLFRKSRTKSEEEWEEMKNKTKSRLVCSPCW